MSKNLLNLLLIVTTFALYFLVIGPLYKGVGGIWQPQESIQSLRQLNVQYDETLAQAENLYSQAETLRGQYMRITEEQKKQMMVMVPDSIDKVRLLSEVKNISESVGIPLSELSYNDGLGGTGRGAVGISFTVEATYPRFKEFIDVFEKSMRLFSIQGVTFNASEKGGDLMSYQVKLETYYMK